MTDNELLQFAAKAAGKHLTRAGYVAIDGSDRETARNPDYDWNPLTNDGDALRLAVRLQMFVSIWKDGVCATGYDGREVQGPIEQDPYAATRRAIVRAAAEIGQRLR